MICKMYTKVTDFAKHACSFDSLPSTIQNQGAIEVGP